MPESKIVNTSASFVNSYLEINETSTHSHGLSGEHVHNDLAFTTWIDPLLAIKQAKAIMIALQELLPKHKNEFLENFNNLKSDLLEIDRNLSESFKNYTDKSLLASHPVYQYLGARYKLDIKSLDLEPGEIPDTKQVDKINNLIKKEKYIFILWEDSPIRAYVELFKKYGIESVTFNPSANRPNMGDYLTVMQSNINNINFYLSNSKQ